MGVILDSTVVIEAERRGETVEALLDRTLRVAGDQEAAISAIGLAELVHGLHRSFTAEIRAVRQAFLDNLLASLTVYPFTQETAMLAGRLDAEQRARGIVIQVADLLIGSTALSLDCQVVTTNRRHFAMIPGLQLLSL